MGNPRVELGPLTGFALLGTYVFFLETKILTCPKRLWTPWNCSRSGGMGL